jgi:hypothetical protein
MTKSDGYVSPAVDRRSALVASDPLLCLGAEDGLPLVFHISSRLTGERVRNFSEGPVDRPKTATKAGAAVP